MLTDPNLLRKRRSLRGSQCTFWCRVLTDPVDATLGEVLILSQCTFWCRVLTDACYQAY